MKNLLNKELRLALHPTCFLFLFLSALLLIPNYPFYVTFFYTGLAIFFTCLSGRENMDIMYTALLPVRKTDIVKSRMLVAVLLECIQLLLAMLFGWLRRGVPNLAGLDANLALLGLSLVLLGIFNITFFPSYYKAPEKVGKSFVFSSTAVFVYILLAEACTFVLPFFHDQLDTPDPAFLPEKLLVLAVGVVAFLALTFLAYTLSKRNFEPKDL